MFPLLSRLLVKQMISMSSSVIFSFTMCLSRNIRKLRELVSGLVMPWFIQVHLDLYWNRVCMQQLPWRKIISSFVYFFFFFSTCKSIMHTCIFHLQNVLKEIFNYSNSENNTLDITVVVSTCLFLLLFL